MKNEIQTEDMDEIHRMFQGYTVTLSMKGEHRLAFHVLKKAFEKGNKVKASIRFKGRQIAHPELAKEVLDRFYNEVSDVAEIELKPRIEGRTMFMQLTPKK